MDKINSEIYYTLQIANQLWVSKKFTEAWQLYFRVLQHRPWSSQLLFHLGTLSHQEFEYEKAIGWYSLAIAQGENSPKLYNNLGESFRALGKLFEAMKCFNKGLQLNPNLAQLHNNLGLVQFALGDLFSAEKSFQTAVSLMPGYSRAQRNLARVSQDLGKRIVAAECYIKSRIDVNWPLNSFRNN